MKTIVAMATLLLATGRAEALTSIGPNCTKPELPFAVKGDNEKGPPKRAPIARITVGPDGAKLVVRLEDPPRVRVTLSIDNEKGNHYELVWDPAINDGLQHEVLLPEDVWTMTPSAEYERVQAQASVFTFATSFMEGAFDTSTIVFNAKNTVRPASSNDVFDVQGEPRLRVSCNPARVQMSELHLDRRKIAAVASARGLLDKSIPEPVASALSLLAEIAMTRAKSGAMDLIREKFVAPVCDHLTLGALGLGGDKRLLPRTCTIAEQLRLEDVLSSGRALLAAIEADIRETFVPALIDRVPSLNEQTRTLARVAFKLASRAIDGQLDGIVEIDYLVALLDQMSWATGFEDSEVVKHWLANQSNVARQSSKDLVVSATLPENFDLLRSLGPWGAFPECKRKKVGESVTGSALYERASREDCVRAIVASLPNDNTWIASGASRSLFTPTTAISLIRTHSTEAFGEWLQKEWANEWAALKKAGRKLDQFVQDKVTQLSVNGRAVLESSCAARLVVGVAKWCSSRESCAAGEVAAVLRDPSKVFAPSTDLPWAMCWVGSQYRMPAQIDPYIDLGARLVTFLTPPSKGDERQRIIALIRWMFDAVIALGADDEQLPRIHDVVKNLLEKDYVSALTNGVDIARSIRCTRESDDGQRSNLAKCRVPSVATRALQLMGAVASYARTYEQTKELDAAAARDARRRSLESLIDAATDRRERGGDAVWSLGSNVSIGLTYTDAFNKRSGRDSEVALRLPLGIAFQKLPWGRAEPGIYHPARWFGVHAGIQLADLGQFARETANDVTWATFVAPGIEFGALFGAPQRTINISMHVSYAPSLADGLPPVWRYGISLGYYVPFFDLN